jgi:transposase InsO family protein
VRYQFIQAHQQRWSVALMCKVLEVSSSGYYEWRRRPESKRKVEDRKLVEQIRVFHCGSRATYGSPRIHRDLKKAGYHTGKKRVARLMRQEGIQGKCKAKYKITTKSKDSRPVAPNLLKQEFQADSINQKWVSDITYILTQEGWLYLAVVLDLYSRRVVGWAMSARLTDDLTIRALKMAIYRRTLITKPDLSQLIFHSDRGSQYASYNFRAELHQHNITQSMSGKGNCFDNAVAESFFATLKTEEVIPNGHTYLTRQIAMTSLFSYMEGFYNRTRRHSTLGYLSPLDFEAKEVQNHRRVA